MRARILSSKKEQTEKERERERQRKQFRNHLLEALHAAGFSFIYTWKTEHNIQWILALACNKTGGQKVFLVSREECSPVFPLSERERSEKRTPGLINTRPAHVLSSTNRIESVARTPHHLSRELYPPRCCDSRSSWAVVPGRTSPRRLG